MVFSSMTFLWVFLPILLAVYFLAQDKLRNYVLLVASLIFYAWGEPKYIVLMLASIVVNYIFGLLIAKFSLEKNVRGGHSWQQKVLLFVDIAINLGLLAHFKYFNFFIDSVNNIFGEGTMAVRNIALPIGISFYTFQIMSYIIDLYRGEIKVQKNIAKLALYISLFPQLIAGPIVKYHDVDQELSKRTVTVEKFSYGVRRFVYGLGKKVIIANIMAQVADMIFGADITTINASVAWLGAIAYMIQIFFDFSGYSDMAIGLGAMFGFTFMENFNLPYISGSITEFWRRWHISLSTWFKEYLYIPLGGNRKGKTRTYINLWIVFLATGIWHGAAWNFVFWGLYHGFFIFIERLGLKKWLDKRKTINHVYTLFVVLIGWVFFRADGLANGLKYIKAMFAPGKQLVANIVAILNSRTFVVMLIGILLCGIAQVAIVRLKKNKKFDNIWSKRVVRFGEPVLLVSIMVVSIAMLVSSTYNPFIYFRF